jgi:hypothetical protein
LAEWRADGDVLGREPVLLDCKWVPAPVGTYPDAPPSPKPAAADGSGSPAPVPEPPKVYRPPHASGKIAEMMREGRSGPGGVKLLAPALMPAAAEASARRHVIPGMDPDVLARAGAGKKKHGAVVVQSGTKPPGLKRPSEERLVAAKPADGGSSEPEPLEDDKLLRKLRKTLNQICEIEEKGPANDEQRLKLTKKTAVEQELALLEARLSKLTV